MITVCAVCSMVKGHTQNILPVNKFVEFALITICQVVSMKSKCGFFIKSPV